MGDVENRLRALEEDRQILKNLIRSANDRIAVLDKQVWDLEIITKDMEETFKEIKAKMPHQTLLGTGGRQKVLNKTMLNKTVSNLEEKVNKTVRDLEEKFSCLREDMLDHLPERWEDTEQGLMVKCSMDMCSDLQKRFSSSIIEAELESRVAQLEMGAFFSQTDSQSEKTTRKRKTDCLVSIARLRDNLNSVAEEISVVRGDMDYFVRGYLDVKEVKRMKGQLEDSMAQLREILDGTPIAAEPATKHATKHATKRARVSFN